MASRLVSYLPGACQLLHRHDDCRLLLFTKGGMREETFGTRRSFLAGDLFFRPPFYAHENETASSGCECIRLAVSQSAVRRWMVSYGWRIGVGRLASEVIANLISTNLSADVGDDLLRELSPVMEYGSQGQRSDMLVESVLSEAVNLEAIARRRGWPPYRLTRRFLAVKGITPVNYRREARLHKALECLAHSTDTVASIAFAAGYCDQSHLSRVFRREIGLTIAEFRGLVTDA